MSLVHSCRSLCLQALAVKTWWTSSSRTAPTSMPGMMAVWYRSTTPAPSAMPRYIHVFRIQSWKVETFPLKLQKLCSLVCFFFFFLCVGCESAASPRGGCQRQRQLELHPAPRGSHQGQDRCVHRYKSTQMFKHLQDTELLHAHTLTHKRFHLNSNQIWLQANKTLLKWCFVLEIIREICCNEWIISSFDTFYVTRSGNWS